MNRRIQFTPELTVALLCAGGWCAVWLLAVHPVQLPGAAPEKMRAEFTRLIADEKMLDKLKAPTLFALPSEAGFSGRFIQDKIERHITLDKPAPAERFLPMQPPPTPRLDPDQLSEKTVIVPDALPAPGIAQPSAPAPSPGAQLFFSPGLKSRATGLSLELPPAAAHQEPVRANLSVRSDGTVDRVFFETPVTNAALVNAVRSLKFQPAADPADGWVDIRFAQEGAK